MRLALPVLVFAVAVCLLPVGRPLVAPVMAGLNDLPQLAPEQPAGTLVMDRATRLPAVGGMPVEFRRSSDRSGPGALVHEFHITVSMIRTLELLMGLPPMNALDAAASPIDVFRDTADLSPYKAVLPEIAPDNHVTPEARAASGAAAYWMAETDRQDLAHPDMADPRTLNRIIWFSVRGPASPMPALARLPAFDAMQTGIRERAEREDRRPSPELAQGR